MEPALLPELLAGLLRRDEAAWRTLIREYAGILLAVARRTFANHGYAAAAQDAEDAVADVWKNLLDDNRQLLRRAQEKGNFLQLLVVLTRHRSVDIMRRHKFRTEPLSDDEVPVAAEPEPLAEPPPAVAAAAMRTLNSRERVCIRLFFLQRKKYREISALTGMSINSIGPTLQRALVKLRQAMNLPGEEERN